MSLHTPTTRPKASIGKVLQRGFMGLHVFFYQRTGGSVGGKMAGRSMLLLTTTGRKSGQERITPIFYFPDGDRFVLIGSAGGSPRHPQWWLNLQAKPQAKIQVGRQVLAVTAQEATGEERQRLWSLVTTRYPDFLKYQQGISREIPVVILSPDK